MGTASAGRASRLRRRAPDAHPAAPDHPATSHRTVPYQLNVERMLAAISNAKPSGIPLGGDTVQPIAPFVIEQGCSTSPQTVQHTVEKGATEGTKGCGPLHPNRNEPSLNHKEPPRWRNHDTNCGTAKSRRRPTCYFPSIPAAYDHPGIDKVAVQLGMRARPGEGYPEFRERLIREMCRRESRGTS